MIRWVIRLGLWAALVSQVAGCFVASGNGPCAAGTQRDCVCPGGGNGTQSCNATGVGYGACVCGPSAASVTPACAAYANAYCTLFANCDPVNFARDYSDMADCVGGQQGSCVASLILPTVTLTADQRMACASAHASESCADYQNGVALAACALTPGRSITGASCTFNAECQTDFCQTVSGDSCGTCSAASTPGSSCPCSAGFACVNDACVATVPLGGSCSSSVPCANSNVTSCLIPSGQTTGMCVARVGTAGAPCGSAHGAGSCNYELGLYCNRTTQVCTPYDFVTAGQPCGYEANGGYAYCRDGACINVTSGIGTCVARAGVGQACDTAGTTGAICRVDSLCVSDSSAAGASCQRRGSGSCSPATGDECTGVTDCATCASLASCGWCNGNGTCQQGTASGASNGTCSGADWDWVGATC